MMVSMITRISWEQILGWINVRIFALNMSDTLQSVKMHLIDTKHIQDVRLPLDEEMATCTGERLPYVKC